MIEATPKPNLKLHPKPKPKSIPEPTTKRLSLTLGLVSVVVALTAGCAGTNTGDRMKSHAASIEDISRQWKQGNDLVAAGEKTKAKGSSLVAEGQKQMTEGESQITRGKTLMAESENAFRDSSRQSALK